MLERYGSEGGADAVPGRLRGCCRALYRQGQTRRANSMVDRGQDDCTVLYVLMKMHRNSSVLFPLSRGYK